MVLISSCITGVKCRYNASSSYNKNLLEKIGDKYIHICPEILAGFKIPRKPCEINGGSGEDVLTGNAKVINNDGLDITEQILIGISKALQICLENNVAIAYLQTRSPTCGCNKIYDGTFSSTLKKGNGVFTAILIKNGIEVVEVE
jgi:uncharacterized protein YbbK (DUF523 family)